MQYTPEQAAQMADDTTVDPVDEVATVAWAVADEDAPGFYYDFEWLEWFEDTHPEWRVNEMTDRLEGADYVGWSVTIERRR